MLLNSEEIAGRLECGSCPYYMDPVFKSSPKKYESFIAELHRAGVLKFASSVWCVNGLFFVTKKDGRLRLIVDARVANTFFRRPPTGETGSAANLADLKVPDSKDLWISQYDVKDFSIA